MCIGLSDSSTIPLLSQPSPARARWASGISTRRVTPRAAAADRTSFGCSNDSDLTYFGEAFYRDALPGARSMRAAFESAKAAIAARERREHV
jgi:hypothetical protein